MQKVAKNAYRRFVVLGLVILASCNSSKQFAIDGAPVKFCLPRAYAPQNVWFAPKDPPGVHGFSFMGCPYVENDSEMRCTLPPELISATVLSLSANHNRLWRDLKSAAVFKVAADTAGATISIDRSTKMLVMANSQAWPEWFIFKRGQMTTGKSPIKLRDEDRLVAVCSELEKFPGGAAALGKKFEFACKRYSRGKWYAIDYAFASNTRVPSELELARVDKLLFDQVNSWQCK